MEEMTTSDVPTSDERKRDGRGRDEEERLRSFVSEGQTRTAEMHGAFN
jgi:5'-deoxynucleotidase YfbR-like HD superfamily hydrolase